jgi:hypothetical protein
MKKIVVTLLFLIGIGSASIMAQAIKKTLELPEIKGIYVNSNYTVYVKQTNKQEVVVEALPEIYELTSISVVNGILLVNVERKPDAANKSIWAKIDDIKINPTMKIYISVKNINDLQVNGGGKIITENSLASPNLTIAVSGNGSMDLDIKGEAIKAEVSGSGKIALRGYASSIDVLMSGSGIMNAFSCELETAKVKMSGSGLCELTVRNTLDALVAGSGVVKHKGNTKNTTRKVYGSGDVERAY